MRHDEWLPREEPPRRRRAGYFLRRAMTVVLCFSLGVGMAAAALVWQDRDNLLASRVTLESLGQPPASEDASEADQGLGEAKTILVIGDDSGEVDEEYRSLATGDRDGHRTDTIMVMRIDPESKRVTGINFPRDLFLTLCDGSQQRINAAWLVGGADCLVKTIRDFAGLRIDHFVSVDFQGFVEIVNAVDGVTMYLEEPMEDSKAHIDLRKGCVTLDGAQALGFVRSRAFDSDFGRIARQQRFVKELADEATSVGVMTNPVRLFQTVDAVSNMLTVDDGMSISTMRDIALTMRGIESKNISMARIPTTTDTNTWYEHPIEDQTRDMVRAFKRGELAQYLGDVPEDASESPSDAAAPEPKIPLDELEPITVLNASGVSQLAAQTADVLAGAGVAIAGTGDAGQGEPTGVQITYPRSMKAEAKALKVGAFPDATLRRDLDAERVTVVLDGDFDPDLMTVEGAGDSGSEAVAEAAPEENQYVNAEPVDKENC